MKDKKVITKTFLLGLSFKKKGNIKHGYWFELKVGRHRFLTNDNSFNKNKDKWVIGYENTSTTKGDFTDVIWLENCINTPDRFHKFFEMVTNKSLLKYLIV